MPEILLFTAHCATIYRDPTPSVSKLVPVRWKPATREDMNTMVIREELALEKHILQDRMSLWREMYRKYVNTSFTNYQDENYEL